MNKHKDKTLHVGVYAYPMSADPIEGDWYVNMLAYRAVYSTLVTDRQATGIKPLLAKSWAASSDSKTWEFKLNKAQYETDEEITAKEVALSLGRSLILMQKRGSKTALVKNVKPINLLNLVDPTSGIYCKDNETVVINLIEPVPDILATLTHTNFSIIHPSTFDHKTLNWNENQKAISSGFYKIDLDKKNLSYTHTLRAKHLPFIRHKDAPERIVFSLKKNVPLKSLDVVFNTYEFNQPSEGHTLKLPSAYNAIFYLRIYTWKDKAWSLGNRVTLKKAFYEKLSKSTLSSFHKYNFLPETNDTKSLNLELSEKERQAFSSAIPVVKILRLKGGNLLETDAATYLEEAINSLGSKIEWVDYINPEDRKKSYDIALDPASKSYPYDISFFSTSINYDLGQEEVRYMFVSTEGILLPDADGSIHKVINQLNFSLSTVNELLNAQSIVIPLAYVKEGIAYKKEKIDLSGLNSLSSSPDLSYSKLID